LPSPRIGGGINTKVMPSLMAEIFRFISSLISLALRWRSSNGFKMRKAMP
jgi:hypothetical protein